MRGFEKLWAARKEAEWGYYMVGFVLAKELVFAV